MSGVPETDDRSTSERSIAVAWRARSFESRAGSILSLVLVGALGAALLAWYYGEALKHPARASEAARALAASRAQGEMPLPPLPPLPTLGVHEQKTPVPDLQGSPPHGSSAAAAVTTPMLPTLMRPAPMPPTPMLSAPLAGGTASAPMLTVPVLPPASVTVSPVPATAHRRALERRLSGPAFATQSASDPAARNDPAAALTGSGAPASTQSVAPELTLPNGSVDAAGGASAVLARSLVPTVTPAVAARVLPTRTLLLPKGAFIDCTLETAIDSTLPGMTTCITATDTFGADGKVVLLERGSKLVGETRGEVQQSSSRVFVLWTEARTPTGVVIPLASPGTDELGRSGLPGAVNRHFFQRFGAALLISIIDAGAEAAAQSRSGTVIYSPAATEDVMSEVLKDTLRIPPTIVKHQGDRIQVLVARDLDFRTVYELHAANPQH